MGTDGSHHDAVADVLAAVPLFRRLSRRQREQLAGHTTRRSFREGTTIVRQGDTGISFYVVLSGRLRSFREGDGGAEVDVAELGPGDYFGDMDLIDDLPRSFTVVAEEPTECALLAKWDFHTELREDPDIALALLPVLNAHIRRLDAELAAARRVSPD
jgi:CRP-like cAMP-binding protein